MRRWRGATVVACVAAGGLAGCSGDGGAGGAAPEGPGFMELLREGDAIQTEALSAGVADPAALPTSGRATYEGVIALGPSTQAGLPDALTLAGEMELQVRFDRDDLTGRASSFVTAADERVRGEVLFTGGRIDRAAEIDQGGIYTFETINASGSLTAPDGSQADVTLGYLNGNFSGEGAGYAGGRASVFLEDRATGEAFQLDGIFDTRR